uniref:non-specific serine/threonine protein kinase n=1 Tax=Cannabis sativa TaxID=3483 RepID=A0A803P7X4_CANSA
MVFKGRFFSSKKSSDTSSNTQDASSNSPRSIGSSSPLRSDKKKSSKSSSSASPKLVKDGGGGGGAKKKGKETLSQPSTPNSKSSFGGGGTSTSLLSDKVSSLGASNLSKPISGGEDGSSGKKKGLLDIASKSWADNVSNNSDSMSTESRDQSPNVLPQSRLQNGESSSEAGKFDSSSGPSGGLRSSDVCTPEMTTFDCDNPKESESPRFQAILRVTSAPRKRFPADIKSFSHELNSKGVRPYPFYKPRGLNNLEEILVVIRGKFDKAKEEVNSDLAIFAADLVGILEKNADTHPEWQETIEDLLILARRCAMTTPGEFWLQCESIVQDLDDRRQELSPGMLKQLHTRMLFILTRCTRLLQFHKESRLAEDAHVLQLRQSRVLHSVERVPPALPRDAKSSTVASASKAASTRKSYSQEQHGLEWKRDSTVKPGNLLLPSADETSKNLESSAARDRMTSWKKFPSPSAKTVKEAAAVLKEPIDVKVEQPKLLNRKAASEVDLTAAKPLDSLAKDSHDHSSKHRHKASWGYWGDQQPVSDDNSIICRICEEEVPTSNVEDHSRICAVADRCDQKGLSVDERLLRLSDTLEKLMESFAQKDNQLAVGSPDVESIKFKLFMDDLKGLPSMSCKTRFGPKSDQGMTTSSAGSLTPRSPLLTPRTSQIDLLLAGKGAYSEQEDLPQMNELADIARCVANTPLDDDRSNPYLLTCLEDLRVVIDRRKFDALTVETFGTRIEKLIREKYLQLCELVEDEKVDLTSSVIDEDAPLDDDVVRSLRTSPVHSSRDRTSIDDFEIIKPISRGAFGRVFLAKKRTTGDLFAIKVLKKADMIRKNAVESILAERDILISVRNPFVVRFFYSFTCRENLYLVMEYLNGGDLYSLLRNLGCLEEDVARVYIAEVVLALEYLHSLRVVHRDLKPDNLLIAHDGHIKLASFGLSKVGLINSTDDLSGPAVSTTSLMAEDEPELSLSEHQQEKRKKRSAVGTPDYLAPEILLGTGHGTTADWWSVGVILFELIVGIPPFNAEHPQTIFDNILNRKIPWPRVPDEMSPEAADLIDRLLTEDPNQRLGAAGASEVKQHVFFKDINWDTLARQKAAFVPSSESALDTSYFTSRYSWNTSDDHGYPPSELEDSSDDDSLSGSNSGMSLGNDEVEDECATLAEFDLGSNINYSFSNFSFKNLSQLASINYDLLSKGYKDDPPNNSNA